eukprot:g533.t1
MRRKRRKKKQRRDATPTAPPRPHTASTAPSDAWYRGFLGALEDDDEGPAASTVPMPMLQLTPQLGVKTQRARRAAGADEAWSAQPWGTDGPAASARRPHRARAMRAHARPATAAAAMEAAGASAAVAVVRIRSVAALPITPREDGSLPLRYGTPARRRLPPLDRSDPLYIWLASVDPQFPRRYMRAFVRAGYGTLDELCQRGLRRGKEALEERVRNLRVVHAMLLREHLKELIRRRADEERRAREAAELAARRAWEAEQRLRQEWLALTEEDMLAMRLRAAERVAALEAEAHARALAAKLAARARHDRLWRGLTMAVFRALAMRQEAACISLQRTFRGWRSRKQQLRVWVRANAGLILTAAGRGMLARSAVRRRRAKFRHGALSLQRIWRGQGARREAWSRRLRLRAITRLQAAVRALLALRFVGRRRRRRVEASRRLEVLRQRGEAASRQRAAVSLQARQRGVIARERMRRAKEARARAAVDRARRFARQAARRLRRRKRRAQERAATMLQTRVRGWEARRFLRAVLEKMKELETEERRRAAAMPESLLGPWCPIKQQRCSECGSTGKWCKLRVGGGDARWQYEVFVNGTRGRTTATGINDIEDIGADCAIVKL